MFHRVLNTPLNTKPYRQLYLRHVFHGYKVLYHQIKFQYEDLCSIRVSVSNISDNISLEKSNKTKVWWKSCGILETRSANVIDCKQNTNRGYFFDLILLTVRIVAGIFNNLHLPCFHERLASWSFMLVDVSSYL